MGTEKSAVQNKPISGAIYLDKNSYKLWVVSLSVLLFSYLLIQVLFAPAEYTLPYYILLGIVYGVLWITTSILIDTLYYVYGYTLYDPRLTVVRGYSISCYLNDTLHSVGLDYGFNFYDGNYNKTRDQAQIDKFEYAIATLGIKKGDKVLDIGCGCGDWINYLKTKYSCDVYGINITLAQTVECNERGLNNVYCSDWKDILRDDIQKSKKLNLQDILYGKFDAVSFWDTVEHYVSMGEGLGRRKNRYRIYGNMFKLAKLCLNKNSKHSNKMKVWISCLHMRREVWMTPCKLASIAFCGKELDFRGGKDDIANGKSKTTQIVKKANLKELTQKMLYIYLLDKFHSGFYPSYYVDSKTKIFHDELVENAEMQGFKLVSRKDTTMDYYMTSVLNPTHFGRHHYSISLKRLFINFCNLFIDPFWLHRRLWFMKESWMYQFDPKDLENSDVILWWLHFQVDTKK